MTVFADTPRWPRHGTVWGHLISDVSLEELHAVAERAVLHPRSFDLDHYDWPDPARGALAAAGVRFVGNRELTRILLGSGLRIPASARPGERRARTLSAAAALGLRQSPLELVLGMRGHVGPLPALPGAFRLTCDESAPPRVQAHDRAGEEAAARFRELADRASLERTGARWVGQVRDAPEQTSDLPDTSSPDPMRIRIRSQD